MAEMFRRESFEDELAALMEDKLVTHAIERQEIGLNKFAQAMEHLFVVAEIFDELGLEKEAEYTTQLLEIVAAKKKKKKPAQKSKTKSKSSPTSKSTKKSPPVSKSAPKKKEKSSTEDLTSEEMVENFKHKGWAFSNDVSDVNDASDDSIMSQHDSECLCGACADDLMSADDDGFGPFYSDLEDKDEDWKTISPFEKHDKRSEDDKKIDEMLMGLPDFEDENDVFDFQF